MSTAVPADIEKLIRYREWREQHIAMAAIDQDADPNKAYLGIQWLWNLPSWHILNKCGQWHDTQYDLARVGIIKGPNSDSVDAAFRECCEKIVATISNPVIREFYEAEIVIFVKLCHDWGRYRWPEAAKS